MSPVIFAFVDGSVDAGINMVPSDKKSPLSHQGELVVLVHGFGRTARDMRTLKKYFDAAGYETFTPTLPSWIVRVSGCAGMLSRRIEKLDTDYTRIHFVGHSMGGLIIRAMFAQREVKGLGRCVLIGTPNGGTPLAEIVVRRIPPVAWLFRPYYDLYEGMDIGAPLNVPPPEMGAIAGTDDGLRFGSWIGGESDGRVPVGSVPFGGMTEMITLPYHHEEIHHKKDTAEYIERFLVSGAFK